MRAGRDLQTRMRGVGEQHAAPRWPEPIGPVLDTPFQIWAEKLALRIMAREEVKAAAAETRRRLSGDPATATAEGLAALDRAVGMWLTDLTLREIACDPARPGILHTPAVWPRTWHGHTFPGAAIAGDSPDNIQRSTFLHGQHAYLLTGRVPSNRSAQFTLAFSPDFHISFGVGKRESLPYDRGLGMLRDEDLEIEADGRVAITIDGEPANGRRNHFQIPPMPIDIWFRENLSDWRQEPVRWRISRNDDLPAPPPRTEDEIAASVAEGLGDFAAHWARHKETFFSHPPVNTLGGPMYRKGGFGFLAFGFFSLGEDEALLARFDNADARYFSLQILDRWYIALDRGGDPISRNNSQLAPDPDGSVTYIISRRDSGAPNWISTGGLQEGIVLPRWQGLAEGAEPRVLDYRVVRLDEIRSLLPPGTRWVTPAERTAEIARRAADLRLRYAL